MAFCWRPDPLVSEDKYMKAAQGFSSYPRQPSCKHGLWRVSGDQPLHAHWHAFPKSLYPKEGLLMPLAELGGMLLKEGGTHSGGLCLFHPVLAACEH